MGRRYIDRRTAIASLGAMTVGASGCLQFEESGEVTGTDAPVTTQAETASTPTDQNWSFRARAPFSSPPRLANGTLYVGGEDGTVYALSPATGKGLWSFEAATRITTIQPFGDGVLVTGQTEEIALDGGGDVIFHTEHRSTGMPLVTESATYTGNSSHIYRRETGSEEFDWQVDIDSPMGGRPAIEGEMLVATDAGDVDVYPSEVSTIYGIHAESGEIRWERSYDDDSLVSDVAIVDGVAIIGGRHGTIAGFAISNGELRWSHSFEQNGNVPPEPLVVGEMVFLSLSNTIYAIDPTDSEIVWTVDRSVGLRMRHRDGLIFPAKRRKPVEVIGLDPDDGEVVERQQTDVRGNSRFPPEVDDAAYYVLAEDASVHRIERTSGGSDDQ